MQQVPAAPPADPGIIAVWVMVLSVLACNPLCEAATAGQADSIGASFDAFWTAARARPFQAQEALWNRIIERPRADVYANVVWEIRDHPDWKERKDRQLRGLFAKYPQLGPRIAPGARTLKSQIPVQARRFRRLFPDAAIRPRVELVLAPNFDAKSGVLGDGTPVLAFAVDTLLLERANSSVIFPHELFHLYHATHSGIHNDGVMPGADLTLPLFAEGLATYVSAVLSTGHSDGELLLQNDLGVISAARLPEVASRFLENADEPAVDPGHAVAFERWFTGSNRQIQPDLPNRAGYWLGLHVIRHLRRRFSLHEMAAWSPAQAQTRTRAALTELAGR